MELTQEQAAAVEAEGRRIAVVAGAGTGKTRVLTERYLKLVERGAAVRRILALTFTEKAAREMKGRIREAMVGRASPAAVRDAEFAPISTIHAFLARLLRERALDVGLDPRFALADELTAESYLEHALRETIDDLSPEDRDLLSRVVQPEELLRQLYLAARATPLAMNQLEPPSFDLESLRVRMQRFLDAAVVQDSSAKGTAKKLDALRADAESFAALDPDYVERFALATKGTVATALRPLFGDGKKIAKDYALVPWVEPAREYGAAIVRTVVALDHAYAARKRADGLLDFADLEREGYALLRSNAAASIRADYTHLLVDEYQDTSRIQEAIIEELAQGLELFGVGDEKQSIYRFRYADAKIFEDLQTSAQCFRLSGSFRSRPEIVAFNNEVFRELFAATPMAEQTLEAARPWDPQDEPAVELVCGQGKRAIDARRAEAAGFATRLREIVESKRGITYGDAALLLRATTHLSIYERAFAEAEIPYVVVRGRGYYQAREVVDLAHLLLLIEDPSDDFCAASALTSLFCGVPEADLLHLPGQGPLPERAAGAKRPAEIPPARWERLTRFAARFRRWRDLASRIELGDLIETILRESKCDVLMLLQNDGRRRYANLHKAMRRARRHAESPAQYARALLEFREREQRESEAPIAAETDDAVKIMTIHASKGLEFPLVMVGSLNAQRGAARSVVLRPDGSFSFRIKAKNNISAPGADAIREWDKEAEKREVQRLYYVAFTRAERHLLLGCGRKTDEPGLLEQTLVRFGHVLTEPKRGWRIPKLARAGVTQRAVRAAVRRGHGLPLALGRANDEATELLRRIDTLPRRAPNRAPYVVAVADLVEFQRCPRRYRLKRMLGIEFDDPREGWPDEGWREASDVDEFPRRELGTVFHELMAESGPFDVPTRDDILRYLPEANDATVAKLTGWAEWTRDLPIVDTMEPDACEREMPFLARLGRWAVRGVMDLYCSTPALLLDYKTGATVRAEAYATQVAVYLAALRSMGRPAPDRAYLIYVDAQEVVEVPDQPLDDLLYDFAEAHTRTFEPTPSDVCHHCEFRSACLANGVACPDR